MNADPHGDDGVRQSRLLAVIARDRDTQAFKLLFEMFAPRIRAFAGRGGADRVSVEDVVQETFVNIWRKAHLYDPEKSAASTWIFTIARNARIDLLRKSMRPVVDPLDPAFVPDPVQTPHQRLSQAQENERLARALATLPAEQREVLHLAFFADMAHGEIADRLQIPLGTVKSRIRLALKRIRLEFEDEQ